MQDASTVDELIGVESNAARVYWDALADVPVHFPARELSKVPEHWRTFGLRRSPITGRNRNAANVGQASLNYLYRLAEAETTLALAAVNLDPALGIWHTDLNNRASFSLDVLEAVRPDVDRYLLTLLQGRTFSWSDFHETRQGACRLLAPLTHELAKSARELRRSVLPIVEFVANEIGNRADPPVRIGTPLTGEWRIKNVGAWPKRMKQAVATSAARCQECGAALTSRRRKFCDACLAGHRKRHNRELGATGRRALERMRTSNDPAAVTARVRRSEALSRRMRELRAWERQYGTDHDWERYEAPVQR